MNKDEGQKQTSCMEFMERAKHELKQMKAGFQGHVGLALALSAEL
jgi:hypothetical protein